MRRLASLALGCAGFAACASDAADGTNGGTPATTSGASTGGGNGGTGSANVTTSSVGGAGGEANSSCRISAVECLGPSADTQERCYTLAELADPCSGTHLWSVHPAAAGAAGAAGSHSGGELMGDGGTDECPSAEELYWGDEGVRCGCFDHPACTTPTVQRGSRCCYQVDRSCRLC